MTLDALRSRLHKFQRNGSGWKALCPAHVDKNPSLSISERDGKILLFCHAGCSFDAVLAALRIESRDLFSDSNGARECASVRKQDGPGQFVEAYDYTDEHGSPLYQNVRYEPKNFRLRRPNGAGGWEWNVDSGLRTIYNLPAVLAATSVIWTEGERDANTAKSLGLVSTTSGSATSWQERFSDHLKGKRVAIIADADAKGRRHAQQVAASIAGKASLVKVLEFPNAKDLSEWTTTGGNRNALLELIRNSPEWKAKAETTFGFTLAPLGELLARPDVPVEYVLEGMLVAGTSSCVAAKPKVGKSTFARNLCLAVSRGENFLGRKTKRGECIYFALEEREEDLKNDFRAMGAVGGEQIYVHAAAAPVEGVLGLCDLVRQRHPVLVVIDPLFRMARIRDEKAYAEVYAALGPLIDIAREAGTHIMLTHHAGKSMKADAIDAPLGSTAIGGAVASLVHLKRGESSRTIQTVQRIGQDLPETVLEFDSNTHTLSLGAEKSEADIQGTAAEIFEYLRATDGFKTEPEIDEAVEGKTSIKRKALRLLVESKKIDRAGAGKRGDPFRYRFLFSCSQDMAGTREQETATNAEAAVNEQDEAKKACSRDSEKSFLVPDIVSRALAIPTEPLIEGDL
jgi:putative DNA primase/helicase